MRTLAQVLTPNFTHYLLQLEFLIILGGILAAADLWFSQSQVAVQASWNGKYLTYIGHGAVWGMLLLGNPAVAHILDKYAEQWTGVTVGWICIASVLFGTGLMWSWCQDPVQSVFMRNGLPTIPGTLNALSMMIMFAVVVMYYTATGGVDSALLPWITLLFVANLAMSLLLPPLAVHGEIHNTAWGQFLGGSILLVLGAIKLLYLPSLHF